MASSNNRNAGRGGKSRNGNNGNAGRGSGKPAASPMKFTGMDLKELSGKVIVYSASKLHMTSQYLKFENLIFHYDEISSITCVFHLLL